MKTILAVMIVIALIIACQSENKSSKQNETQTEKQTIPLNQNITEDKKNIYEEFELKNYVDESGLSEGANKSVTIDIYVDNYSNSKALDIANYYVNYYRTGENNISLNIYFWNKKIEKNKLTPDRSNNGIGKTDWYKKYYKGGYFYNFKNGYTINTIKN